MRTRQKKNGRDGVLVVTVERASFEAARTPYIAADGRTPPSWSVLKRRVTSALQAYLVMLAEEETRATVFDDLAALVIPLSLAMEQGQQDLAHQYRNFPALNGQVFLFQGKERSFYDTLTAVRAWALNEGVLPSYNKALAEVELEKEAEEEPGSLLDARELSGDDGQEEV